MAKSYLHTKKKREYAAIEIEKLKAEIDDLDIHYDNDYFSGNKDGMYKREEVLKILNNRISELKGEQNYEM